VINLGVLEMIVNIKSVRMVGMVVALSCAAWTGSAGAAGPAAPVATAASAQAAQPRLEEFHLVAISTSDNMVTLRGPDRKQITLKVGSTLVSARARLVEVQPDRLRFDALDDKGLPQTAWMIRSANPEQELPQVKRSSRARS
jgi:hypothetical protein